MEAGAVMAAVVSAEEGTTNQKLVIKTRGLPRVLITAINRQLLSPYDLAEDGCDTSKFPLH